MADEFDDTLRAILAAELLPSDVEPPAEWFEVSDTYSALMPKGVAWFLQCGPAAEAELQRRRAEYEYRTANAVRVAFPDNDTPAPPSAPIDTVIGDLAAGRVIQPDRMRLGRAIDKANAEAAGHKVKPNEAFGRIRSGNPIARIGLATL